MSRDLTSRELEVLSHVVVDPVTWWQHACDTVKIDHEKALADKVSRWSGDYAAAKQAEGAAYKNRAVRQAEEDAAIKAKADAAHAADLEKKRAEAQAAADLEARITALETQ